MRRSVKLVAALAVAVAIAYMHAYAEREAEREREQRLGSRLEAIFAAPETHAFYELFEKEFPEEYAALRTSALKMIAADRTPEEINLATSDVIAALRRSNSALIARADLAHLDGIIKNQIDLAMRMREIDVSLCAKFLIQSLDSAERKRHPELLPILLKGGAVALRAVANGKEEALIYEESTTEDWKKVVDMMAQKGFFEADIALMAPGVATQADAHRICATGLAMVESILTLDDAARGRILSEMIIEMGKI